VGFSKEFLLLCVKYCKMFSLQFFVTAICCAHYHDRNGVRTGDRAYLDIALLNKHPELQYTLCGTGDVWATLSLLRKIPASINLTLMDPCIVDYSVEIKMKLCNRIYYSKVGPTQP
jgi:hypothetical protein